MHKIGIISIIILIIIIIIIIFIIFLYRKKNQINNTILLQDNNDINVSKIPLSIILTEMKTGDLILFSGKGLFSNQIRSITDSLYSHVGMVISAPYFTNLDYFDNKPLLLHSALEGHKDIFGNDRFGVQISDLKEYIQNYDGRVYWRRLIGETEKGKEIINNINYKLNVIYKVVKDKAYSTDVRDFGKAAFKLNPFEENMNVDEFYCSSLMAYIYFLLGIIEFDPRWGITYYSPKDFGEMLIPGLTDDVSFGQVIRIK